MKIAFVSIIPNLLGGEGHIIDYHKSVGQAANLLNWKHFVACVPDPRWQNHPHSWHPCLRGDNLEVEGNVLQKLARCKSVIQLGLSIARYLRDKILSRSDYTILFIERFIHLQLLAIFLSLLLLPRQNLAVWLLYRRDTHRSKTRWIYKVLNDAIARLLPPGRFSLLTDSKLLSQSLSQYFQKTVAVLPIPHTEIVRCDRVPKNSPEILCWWSGPPRAEKGWDVIKSLVGTSSRLCDRICIIAARSSQLAPISGGVKVQLIEDNLEREAYIKWMNTCDLILIPYDSEAYCERTSGIFTECIIAGKIPLVTPHTWMARELSQSELDELILDWAEPEIVLEKILQISASLEVQNKVLKMQQKYLHFHNPESYANMMQSIFTHSFPETESC
jgi:hypothetical protein